MPGWDEFVETFLLTPLREGRLDGKAWAAEGDNFYSRPCVRGDGPYSGICLAFVISTHAPA